MEKLNTWTLAQYVALSDALRREEGQDFGEYVIIFAALVLLVIVGFTGVKDALLTQLTAIAAAIAAAPAAP